MIRNKKISIPYMNSILTITQKDEIRFERIET